MAIAPYWGGSGANLGAVHPLGVTSFASFVKEVLGHPAVVASVTRSALRAMPKEQRDAHKMVGFFTAATFATNHRCRVDSRHCNLLCLDIDVEKDGTCPARPLVADPQILTNRLHPYAFAAYTTASSTPEAPRLRVVIAAAGIPLESYAEAVQWAGITLLGLPRINWETERAFQPMYLPTIFRGDDPVADHPLIVAVPEGAAVTTASVVGVAPSGNTPSVQPDADASALEYLRPTVEGITLEDVASALEHLDPDCSYADWIATAAAMRHQFPQEADNGFAVFDSWSAKGQKYTTTEDTRTKWDSFKPHARMRAPRTIRSVLRAAAESGWDQAGAVGQRCYAQTYDWLRADARTAPELLQQGIARIAGTPLITALQKGSLLSALHAGLGSRQVKIPRAELKGNLAKLERTLTAQATPTATPDNELPRWARGLCYVATQNEFFQRHTGRTFKPEVVDNYFGVQLMGKSDEDSGAPPVRPRDYLLNVLKCPRVDDYIYSPANGSDAFVVLGHKRAVNTYIPTHPAPDPEYAEEAGAVWMEHMRRLIAEPEYQRTLVDFMAFHVQQPGVKVRWAVLLQGAMGCGKTVISEAMRAVLGAEHVKSIGSELLFTGFNGWASGVQICAIEEIRVVGHNRYEVMNSLKPCISNDFISINEKQIKAYQTPNVTNYLLFTNHFDSIAVSDNDRRYFVLNSPIQLKEQVAAMGTAYFDRLWSVVRTQGGALRSWLEQWHISDDFNPDGHAPATKYLKELAGAAASPLAAAIDELLTDGLHPLVKGDLVSTNVLKQSLQVRPSLQWSDQSVCAVLREHGMVNAGRVRVDGERHGVWIRRDLAVTDLQAEVDRRLCDMLS